MFNNFQQYLTTDRELYFALLRLSSIDINLIVDIAQHIMSL